MQICCNVEPTAIQNLALRKTATRFNVVQLFEVYGNDNDVAIDMVYDDFEPVACFFVKLTVSDWPEGSPLDIIDFMAFGRPAGHLPAAMATPAYYELPPDRSVAGRQGIVSCRPASSIKLIERNILDFDSKGLLTGELRESVCDRHYLYGLTLILRKGAKDLDLYIAEGIEPYSLFRRHITGITPENLSYFDSKIVSYGIIRRNKCHIEMECNGIIFFSVQLYGKMKFYQFISISFIIRLVHAGIGKGVIQPRHRIELLKQVIMRHAIPVKVHGDTIIAVYR